MTRGKPDEAHCAKPASADLDEWAVKGERLFVPFGPINCALPHASDPGGPHLPHVARHPPSKQTMTSPFWPSTFTRRRLRLGGAAAAQ
jgi:hypothetical protein